MILYNILLALCRETILIDNVTDNLLQAHVDGVEPGRAVFLMKNDEISEAQAWRRLYSYTIPETVTGNSTLKFILPEALDTNSNYALMIDGTDCYSAPWRCEQGAWRQASGQGIGESMQPNAVTNGTISRGKDGKETTRSTKKKSKANCSGTLFGTSLGIATLVTTIAIFVL